MGEGQRQKAMRSGAKEEGVLNNSHGCDQVKRDYLSHYLDRSIDLICQGPTSAVQSCQRAVGSMGVHGCGWADICVSGVSVE